jgi:hypothetical protein
MRCAPVGPPVWNAEPGIHDPYDGAGPGPALLRRAPSGGATLRAREPAQGYSACGLVELGPIPTDQFGGRAYRIPDEWPLRASAAGHLSGVCSRCAARDLTSAIGWRPLARPPGWAGRKGPTALPKCGDVTQAPAR